MSHKATPITDEFDHPQGRLAPYDSYSTEDRLMVAEQSHVDIRNFDPSSLRLRLSMVHIDQLTVDQLNTQQMSDLEGDVTVRTPEPWDFGDVDYQSDRNNWRGLTLTFDNSVMITGSVIEE